MKPESREPRSLRRHPLHKAKVAAPDKQSADWIAFVETVRADGRVRDAVKITSDGLVMDGWWRVEAARDLQLDEVPVEVNDPSEAALLIVESLTARKQMTRGAAVYMALGMTDEYTDAAERRRLRNVSSGRATAEEKMDRRSVGSTPQSQRYLAARLGVDHKTVCQAQLVRRFLHDPRELTAWLKDHELEVQSVEETQASLRAEFEPLLFNGEKSLWKVLQAAGGRLSTKDLPKGGEQLELFGNRFSDFITTATRLPDLKIARPVIEETIENLTTVDQLHRLVELAGEIARQAQARAQELKKAGARPATVAA